MKSLSMTGSGLGRGGGFPNAAASVWDWLTRPGVWPWMAALGSGALLAGAFAFEIFGRLPPCPMCIVQRWIHAGALAVWVLMGVGVLAQGARPWLWRGGAGALAATFLGSAAYAGRHAGVEYGLLPAPAGCSAGDVSGLTAESLAADLAGSINVVMCDEIPWSFLGVSMAGWNALISLSLAVVSIAVLMRRA